MVLPRPCALNSPHRVFVQTHRVTWVGQCPGNVQQGPLPRRRHTVRKVTDRTLGELYRRDGALEGGLAQRRAALTATDSSGIRYCEAHAQGSGCPLSLFPRASRS